MVSRLNVVADSCIGGVAEAASCADKFEKEGVGVSLSVTPCWCYGSETIDMNSGIPQAIWGFNGTDVREPFTWPLHWRDTIKKESPHLGFMAKMFRMQEIIPSLMM